MYAALWRLLPGPFWLRVAIALLLIAAVLSALAFWIYPAVDAVLFPVNEIVTPTGS